jgi:hypothetical protein
MTPKEKAEELVDKFYQTTPNEAWYNPPLASASMEYKAWEQAKQCALIAVDEIMEQLLKNMSNDISGVHGIYWEKVKQEIEAL